MRKMEHLIRFELDNKPELRKSGDSYCYEIRADYSDGMDDDTAVEILCGDEPLQAFDEKMDEWYYDYKCDILSEIEQDVEDNLTADVGPYPEGFTEEEGGVFDDLMRKLVYVQAPEDFHLNQVFRVNIVVDTGDGNYDYALNSARLCSDGRHEQSINDKASVVWLAREQGYTKAQLQEAVMEENVLDPRGFLGTMRQEIESCTSHMAALVFLAEMSLRDLMELNRIIKLRGRDRRPCDATKDLGCGCITISKNAMTGLYDLWYGAGGVFGIELERDVRLPISYIRSALPDGGDGYSIASVYGMSNSAWERGEVKQVCESDDLSGDAVNRSLELVFDVGKNGFKVTVHESESGEWTHAEFPLSPDEHPEFDRFIGNEIYSWISLWREQKEDGDE